MWSIRPRCKTNKPAALRDGVSMEKMLIKMEKARSRERGRMWEIFCQEWCGKIYLSLDLISWCFCWASGYLFLFIAIITCMFLSLFLVWRRKSYLGVICGLSFVFRQNTKSQNLFFSFFLCTSFIHCFHNMISFRLVERKHPKYTFKCVFYHTWSICICRFPSQYISLKKRNLKMSQKSPLQHLHTLYCLIYTDGFIHIIHLIYITFYSQKHCDFFFCLLTVFSDTKNFTKCSDFCYP